MNKRSEIKCRIKKIRTGDTANSYIALLKFVSNDSLLKSMNKLANEENYELAILYRDELILRGILSEQ